MFNIFKSKVFLGVAGFICLIMVITNPGRLNLFDTADEISNFPDQDTHINFVIFTVGNEWATNGGYIRKADGDYGYETSSFHVKYIGAFNNYFARVSSSDTNEIEYKVIPNEK